MKVPILAKSAQLRKIFAVLTDFRLMHCKFLKPILLIIDKFNAPRLLPWKLRTSSCIHTAFKITFRHWEVTRVFSSYNVVMPPQLHLANIVTALFVIGFKLRTSFFINFQNPFERTYMASSVMHVFAKSRTVINFQLTVTMI